MGATAAATPSAAAALSAGPTRAAAASAAARRRGGWRGVNNKVARTLAKRTFGDIMHALPSMADDDSDALKKQVDQLHFLMLGQLDATHDLDAERLAVSQSGKDAADAALARVFARVIKSGLRAEVKRLRQQRAADAFPAPPTAAAASTGGAPSS